MTITEKHAEWISLLEVSGSFLAVSVLEDAFPQGLDKVDTPARQRTRAAYEEWRDAVDESDPQLDALHREWVRLVMEGLLEYDASVLKSGADIPPTVQHHDTQSDTIFRPDFAVMTGDKPKLLVSVMSPGTDLDNPLPADAWLASPAERLIALCRTCGVHVGLVTNGERWMVVSAPAEGGSSRASWYARLWFQEPVTLQAFCSLLGVRRCFGSEEETLDALLTKSLEYQNDVTITLGEQVRRAVEVLVQALDRADQDRNRTLLKDVTPAQLFEAGLTVMMRLVVLLCAEERRLLLLGEPVYDQNYAVTTLRSQLVAQASHGLEILERRQDAWSRLLATFRGIYGGISHETLRLPPLGGSLFDPDRFPFLEGRAPGTSWRDTPAVPLPIDNRTVLLLLNALQVLEHRSGAQLLSYEALDVEQIGHVYEGLLERTVKRVPEVTVGLVASSAIHKKTGHPELYLSELESAARAGQEKLLEYLIEKTGRSRSALRKDLTNPLPQREAQRLLLACGNDLALANRIRPFGLLLRTDSWGDPLVYREHAFIVTHGTGRRETGSHYTPKSLTEPIVKHTLEPLVYIGPAEGVPQADWKHKTSTEILALKVCDMAMGSGAFLVQSCRWLADRLVEAWDIAEKSGRVISIAGEVLDTADDAELLPRDRSERVLIARRLVASRCLYGVDINPMAVEMAKLSLWLITFQRDRPFTFLDHALKCGDSLLGVSKLEHIELFSLRPGHHTIYPAIKEIMGAVQEVIEKRRALELLPSNDHTQIETKNRLHLETKGATAKVQAVADCLIALELWDLHGDAYESGRHTVADKIQGLIQNDANAAKKSSNLQHQSALSTYARELLGGRRAFHWPIEYPEVFTRGGFDAVVGNPPWFFLSGKANPAARLRHLGKSCEADDLEREIESYTLLYPQLSVGAKDYYKWFVGRGLLILSSGANIGLVLSNSFIALPKYKDVRSHLAKFQSLFIFDLGFGYFNAIVACAVVLGANKIHPNEEKECTVFIADLKANKADAWEVLNVLPLDSLSPVAMSDGDFLCFKSALAECIYGEATESLNTIVDIREGHHDLTFATGAFEVQALDDKSLSRFAAPKLTKGWLPQLDAALDHHKGDRFLIRKTGDSIVAALAPTTDLAVAHQNVYVCKPKATSGLSAKAICALVTSTYFTALYQDGPLGQKGRPMAQLRIIGLRRIPIPPTELIRKNQEALERAYDAGAPETDAIVAKLYNQAFPECRQ